MLKNKIEGVKPFNGFWFKSCYYHQLIAGLSCLGISRDAVLAGSVEGAGKDFTVTEYKGLSQKKNEKFFGYRCKPCNITKKTLTRNIDCGRPIIVGLDHFYIEGRADTYYKAHGVHFVLAYGYDMESREVNVTDHDYVNSYLFREKKMLLDNLLEANGHYEKEQKKGRFTCRVLYKRKTKRGKNGGPFIGVDKEEIERRQKYSEENLNRLKRLLSGDEDGLEELAAQIAEYLKRVRGQYLCVSCLEDARISEADRIAMMELYNAYSNLLAVFWRMLSQRNFAYATQNQEAIFRKLDFVLDREKKFFGFLSRCYT